MPHLVDTNILIRICDRSSQEHTPCRAALAELIRTGQGCYSCAQTLIEFWAVATRPREVNGLGLSPADAMSNVTDFRRSLPCLPEPPDIATRWQALVSEHEVRGRKAHDARLVAFMQAHGLSNVLTLNTTDFLRYSGIKPLTPQQVLATLG